MESVLTMSGVLRSSGVCKLVAASKGVDSVASGLDSTGLSSGVSVGSASVIVVVEVKLSSRLGEFIGLLSSGGSESPGEPEVGSSSTEAGLDGVGSASVVPCGEAVGGVSVTAESESTGVWGSDSVIGSSGEMGVTARSSDVGSETS